MRKFLKSAIIGFSAVIVIVLITLGGLITYSYFTSASYVFFNNLTDNCENGEAICYPNQINM